MEAGLCFVLKKPDKQNKAVNGISLSVKDTEDDCE